ncbi:hypothetical protein NB231_04120 [Nitrococcus mobilis Nb-231]|uniref:Sulfotransferase family protein n=1 Tax=Nitrococcus mobilis Nb-231 TaxID=314278 RepID=A4BPQ8_9GAMM|nr:hypothetical protein NB231_04120 [Nitrococcus mobilis Nb-231]
MSRNTAIVVLGAGRSGTSALTRGVQALGVDLGNRLRRGRGKNPTGFFEDRDLLALNKRLKRALGITGESVRLIPPSQWDNPKVRLLRRRAMQTIERRFGASRLWGFKYARTLRMLPFWEAVLRELDIEVRYVVALRNPLSVARSRAQLDPQRGVQVKSDLEWLVNVVPYFRTVAQRSFVVVDYDAMIADPVAQLERAARCLRIALTAQTQAAIKAFATDFLVLGLRHSQFTIEDLEANQAVDPLVRDAYRWLHQLAHDEIASDSGALWEDWQRIEQALAARAPVLEYIDTLLDDLRRAKRDPRGPMQALPQLLRYMRGR